MDRNGFPPNPYGTNGEGLFRSPMAAGVPPYNSSPFPSPQQFPRHFVPRHAMRRSGQFPGTPDGSPIFRSPPADVGGPSAGYSPCYFPQPPPGPANHFGRSPGPAMSGRPPGFTGSSSSADGNNRGRFRRGGRPSWSATPPHEGGRGVKRISSSFNKSDSNPGGSSDIQLYYSPCMLRDPWANLSPVPFSKSQQQLSGV